MVRALYLTVVLSCFTSTYALCEPTAADRDAVLKGSFQGCIEKTPPELKAQSGRLAVARFCSCYASNIAQTVTQEQIDAMLNAKTQADIPGYADTMLTAWRSCETKMTKSG